MAREKVYVNYIIIKWRISVYRHFRQALVTTLAPCIYTPPSPHPFNSSSADWWRNLIKSKIRVTFSRCRYLGKSHVRDILCPPPQTPPIHSTLLVISHSQSLYFVRGRAVGLMPLHFNFLRSRNICVFLNLPSKSRFPLNFKGLIWSDKPCDKTWTK